MKFYPSQLLAKFCVAHLASHWSVIMRFAIVAFVSLLGFSPEYSRAHSNSHPNIVFIMADDLGYGDLGCYGAKDLRTPNLDQLAADGILFTDFYANAPVCSPTRAAFLTGRYQQRIGLDNALYYQEMGRGLPENGQTIADSLQEAGYKTGLSGKWHVGYDRNRQPLQQGFDHFFGLLGGNHHYFKHMDRIGVPDLWLGNERIENSGYTTDLITEDSIRFIKEHKSNPFFLFVSHAAPHFPFQGPNDRNKKVKPRTKSWQIGDRKTYIAMVEHMDQGIGKILAELDRLNLRENTMVVFTSDNGGDVNARNAPFSGKKSMLFEGGIRVPCIVRWPAKLGSGKTVSAPAITMDWTATIRRLIGLKHDSNKVDGIDLMPILTDQKTKPEVRFLFWRRKSGPKRKVKNPSRAIRRGNWKYFERTDGSGERLLFNLKDDPGETKNLIDENQDLAKTLSVELDRWEKSMSGSH